MLQVYKECCKNCLLSPNRIVSAQRSKEIIKNCIRDQTHFMCHKASTDNKDVICHTFFEKFGHYSQMVRIAGRMNMIEFVDQPEGEKLPTFKEMM